MTGPSLRAAVLAAIFLGLAPSCAPPAQATQASEALAPYVVPSLPADLQHRTLLDFGGKLQLVGYEVTPSGKVSPGETVKLRLFWKATGRLGSGWSLFTHLESESGEQLWNYDREGAFRTALSGKMPAGLALLEVGRLYVDEQTLTLPKAEQLTPRITIIVGVWNDRMRLPVVSGPSNGRDAGIVTHFQTGVARRAAPQR
jgi:hypothetical protein